MNWTNERRAVASLKDYPTNPRSTVSKGIEDLKEGIVSIGYVDMIAINTDGTILSGHRRKEVLLELGITEIDVRVPERLLTDKESREVLIRLNRNIAGVWNLESLTSDFEIGSLIEWGFTDFELGVNGRPEGVEFDEHLTDEESVIATFKIKLPATDAERFEVQLDEILREYPDAVKDKRV